MKRSRCVLAAALGAVLAVLSAPVPASAHDPLAYYGWWWQPDNKTILFYFDDSVPSGSFRSRILDGRAQWNYATNRDSSLTAEPQFFSGGQITSSLNPDSVCSHTYNIIYRRDLDYVSSRLLGRTATCRSGTQLLRFTISFDSDRSWYTDTGDAPSDRIDLWSVASHEFGHATGWGKEFPEDSSLCPNDSTRHTMCPGVYYGTERQRTLTTHDIDTYNNRY